MKLVRRLHRKNMIISLWKEKKGFSVECYDKKARKHKERFFKTTWGAKRFWGNLIKEAA